MRGPGERGEKRKQRVEHFAGPLRTLPQGGLAMAAFLLWCLLFVFCWPLALLALILYPIVWLLLLPFRIVGVAVHGVLALVTAVIMLPARLLSAPFRLGRAA